MRQPSFFIVVFAFLAILLAGCSGSSGNRVDQEGNTTNSNPAACEDGIDNDGDGQTDFPNDPGCLAAIDNDETDPPAPACSDGQDNDRDGFTDFPADPGCLDGDDVDETDPPPAACADGQDNDGDGFIDFGTGPGNDPGCESANDNDETDPPQCNDGLDNDGDGETDFPDDNGCNNASDDDETDPPQCSDELDNDADTAIDFPDDPGCTDANDDDETDPPGPPPQCSDGTDNDGDLLVDHPDDPGCDSASDDDETDPPTPPQCSDGIDNDGDSLTDFPNDPGCVNAADDDEVEIRSRYSMNNQCWALLSNANGQFVERSGGTYAATAVTAAAAEPFYMQPSFLGYYLLYNSQRQLLSVGPAVPPGGPAVANENLADATQAARWFVKGVGDPTIYPPTPEVHREPTPSEVTAYRGFTEPTNNLFSEFTLFNEADGRNLIVQGGSNNLVMGSPGAIPSLESFTFVPRDPADCASFPEAQSNASGTTFTGTNPVTGGVLGMVDAHVHISSTNFLGRAQWGFPFDQFGVTHALDNCDEFHGPNGSKDVVGAAFSQDTDGHDTTGWPTFPEWPARGELLHEAIYWKWLERSWLSGLRIIVNDLVDNETLCELQRNVNGDATQDCNSMNNAGRQAGTMYAMQDYIDAQYGGRGQGFYQITHTPAEARAVIERGQAAVILGIEISNVLDCKVNFNPLRTQEPFEETGTGVNENSYTCTMTETGASNEILTQLNRLKGWGVQQIITNHEFDNAFGGNGIFDGLVLNLGNRENSGGIPGTAISNPTAPAGETPTGEFWTTYDCPIEGEPGFDGYLWGSKGGTEMSEFNTQPVCPYLGQGGRPGGPTPCYPDGQQCNARWLTPLGLYLYSRIMELGIIFDIDHLEQEMKTQALELAEAQNPPYPFVSTHGTFGGTFVDQARRILSNGGTLYPSIGSVNGFLNDMTETRNEWVNAGSPGLFGFGFGTDTNGLSAQQGPRSSGQITAQPLTYPFTLFTNPPFDTMPEFADIRLRGESVVFQQPSVTDENGVLSRTWHQDIDGNAHYGMMADFVREMELEATAQDMRDLFNSAERYLQMWEATIASQQGILNNANGGRAVVPTGVLRPAPVPAESGRGLP